MTERIHDLVNLRVAHVAPVHCDGQKHVLGLVQLPPF